MNQASSEQPKAKVTKTDMDVIMEKSQERERRKGKSKYFAAYENFKQDLSMLKELNKQIPRSIKESMDVEIKKFQQDFRKSDDKTRKSILRMTKVLGKFRERMEIAKKRKGKVKSNIQLTDDANTIFLRIVKTFLYSTRFETFIRDMSLVYLIAEFESFLQEILKISFEKEPNSLVTCQKSMTFEDLLKFNDIRDVKQQLIEKEVLSVVNQDIDEIGKYFQQRFNLDLTKWPPWKKIRERFYRRNIIVHNSGVPNKIYRAKTGYGGRNKRLIVSKYYLNDSVRLFDEMATEISQKFFEKFDSE